MRNLFGVVKFCVMAMIVISLLPLSVASAAAPEDEPSPSQPNKSALAISPAIVEHVLEPGVKKEFTLRLTNLTNFPLPISGTVKNFVPLEDIEDPKVRALYDASKWFVIAEPDFILQAKQTRKVSVSITPPASAQPGGHYATVYFQPLLPQGVLTPSTAYLSARVGSLAFLILPGDYEERIAIRSFSAPKFQQTGPVQFDLRLANTGSVHLSPNIKVIIKDWRGKKVEELPGKQSVVLPGTGKTISFSWNNSLALGRYTATAEGAYGSELTKIQSEPVSFWILPWGFFLLVIAPLTILITIAIRTRGRWRKAWAILRGKDK